MTPTQKDPLLWISILLAVTGAIQASTGALSALAANYPLGFGVAMTVISVMTGVLTAIKTSALTTARDATKENDDVR